MKKQEQQSEEKNPFDNRNIETYDAKTFGESVRSRRIQLGLLAKAVAEEVGMSKAYISDIENGIRPAPNGMRDGKCYLSKLTEILDLTESQKVIFYVMAFVSRSKLSYDVDLVKRYIYNNPHILKIIIRAMEEDWDDSKWKALYDDMIK